MFSNFAISSAIFLVLKVIFDGIYSYLIKSNSIQRNILLIGDAKGCQNIIKNFPKKKSTSVIKCVIAIDQADHKDLNFYGVPGFSLNDDNSPISKENLFWLAEKSSSIKMLNIIQTNMTMIY